MSLSDDNEPKLMPRVLTLGRAILKGTVTVMMLLLILRTRKDDYYTRLLLLFVKETAMNCQMSHVTSLFYNFLIFTV